MASLTKLDISRNDIRVAGLALLTDALRDHAGFAKLIMVPFDSDILFKKRLPIIMMIIIMIIGW